MDLLPLKIKNHLIKAARQSANFWFFVKKSKLLKNIFSRSESARVRADKNLVYSLAPTKIPKRDQLKHLKKLLSPREKLILRISGTVLLLGLVYVGVQFYRQHLVLTPKFGGTYREGVVGLPQTINPLYSAARDVDADLVRLIYSSLFQYNQNGRLVPDLVESWKIEDGGKAYFITLRHDAEWHGGGEITAEDVAFTFSLIKDPAFRSPLRANFNGVELEKVDDYTCKFILSEPYADFFSLLTFGILPKNAWEATFPEAAALSELNLKPIGSGPYKFVSLIKNKNGELKEYYLEANTDYYGAKPYIEKIIFKFFPDYTELVRALNANEIEGASYVPDNLRKDVLAKHSLSFNNLRLPQINAIFFNQTKNKALANLKVRQALAYAIDRDHLFANILNNSAIRTDGPILAEDFIYNPDNGRYNLDISRAETLLDEAGFKKINITASLIDSAERGMEVAAIVAYASSTKMEVLGDWRGVSVGKEYQPLVVKLTVPENGRLEVAESIKKDWEKIGVRVILDKVAASSINSDLIISHNFEAFLYGQVVGLEPDVASFWHSSQINGQGFNLSAYNNSAVDLLLTEGRQIFDNIELRKEKYRKFQEIIGTELPTIFLYSPTYPYVQAKSVRGFAGTMINEPSDRLAGVSNWYLKTKKRLAW